MPNAYIVEAVRTAGGRRGGRLAGVHPVDLAAKSLDAVMERSGLEAKAIDDVVMGCVSQGGTRDEALSNVREAIALYLESLEDHGDPVPPPITEEIIEV